MSNCGEMDCIILFCRGGGPQTATELLIHDPTGILELERENEDIKSICDN